MRRFTELFLALERTRRSAAKRPILQQYFEQSSPEDAVWVLYLFTRWKRPRGVAARALRGWLAEAADLPAWLVEECWRRVGDPAEVCALLPPQRPAPTGETLAEVVQRRLLPFAEGDDQTRWAVLTSVWREFDLSQRYVLHKILGGGMRAAAGPRCVVRAAAAAAGLCDSVLRRRLQWAWRPTAEDYARLMHRSDGSPAGLMLPFVPIARLPEGDWPHEPFERVEVLLRRPGLRVQVACRAGEARVWTRSGEDISEVFPELVQAGRDACVGAVVEGDILALDGPPPAGRPVADRGARSAALRARLRSTGDARFWPDPPVVLVVDDLLELDGRSLVELPLAARQAALDRLLPGTGDSSCGVGVQRTAADGLHRAVPLPAADWSAVATWRGAAREHGATGVQIRSALPDPKRRAWFWAAPALRAVVVLMAAQRGHGHRSNLLSDLTFGAWSGTELTPVARTHRGLSREEADRVDAFCRAHTTGRRGPYRWVHPGLVFELAFDEVRGASRRRAGLMLHRPRVARWRTDLTPDAAITLEGLRQMSPVAGALRC